MGGWRGSDGAESCYLGGRGGVNRREETDGESCLKADDVLITNDSTHLGSTRL